MLRPYVRWRSLEPVQPPFSPTPEALTMTEADDMDIAALEGVRELELDAERDSNGAMDEQNLSYMEDPDDLDGRDAQRAARNSESEGSAPGMYLEDLTPQDEAPEDEDDDPVGQGEA